MDLKEEVKQESKLVEEEKVEEGKVSFSHCIIFTEIHHLHV